MAEKAHKLGRKYGLKSGLWVRISKVLAIIWQHYLAKLG